MLSSLQGGSGRDFNPESTDREEGSVVTQNNRLVGVLTPGSFMDQRWGGYMKKRQVKRPFNLANIPRTASFGQGDVLISSLLPSTGGKAS